METDRSQLNNFIIQHFNDEELRILCSVEFRSVYDDFSDGWGKKRKVLELVEWCERQGQQAKLLTILQRERPRPYKTIFGKGSPALSAAQTVTVPVGERNPRQIFVSHAHEDAKLAQQLAADLRAHGWQIWIAPDSIQPGEQWVEAINRGLEESGVFVVLLTPEAVQSKWVKRETNAALNLEHEEELRFFPLNVKPCRVPILWRGYQFISFQNDYQTDLDTLLKILAGDGLHSQPKPIPEQKEAARPVKKVESKPKPSPAKIDLLPPEKPNILISNPPDIRVNPVSGKEMIRIPAGDFLYGVKKEKLHLPEFWIAKTPVTNAEYARFVAEKKVASPEHWQGKSRPPANIADHPVVYISWHNAQAYAKWAGCQLLTEQEWEKAARGVDGRVYPWGDEWQANHCNSSEAKIGTTSSVGQFSPQGDSPYGCVDMSGNVWEWTQSWSDGGKTFRVLCGGSWSNLLQDARGALRVRLVPDFSLDGFGFRVVSPVVSGS